MPLLYQVRQLSGNVKQGNYYAEELQRVELPFDTYEIVDQIDQDTIKVKQLNSENPKEQEVDKNTFLKNQYSLRSKKK